MFHISSHFFCVLQFSIKRIKDIMPNKRKLKKEESNSEFEFFLSNLNNSSFKDEQYERIKSICDLKLADNALNATELWIKNLNPLEVFKMKNVENEDEDDEKRQWKNRGLPDLSEEGLKEYDERIELGHEQLKFFKNTVKVISVVYLKQMGNMINMKVGFKRLKHLI